MSSTEPREAVDVAAPPQRRSSIAQTSTRVVLAYLESRRRHPVLHRLALTVLVVCVGLVISGLVSGVTNLDLATGVAMSIVILGLSFLTGFSGQVSLGNGAFFGIGAYVFAIWANHHNSSIGETLVVCTAAGAVAGLIVGLPATRLRGPYLAGMTIAVAIAFGSLVDEFSTWTNGDEGLNVQTPVTPPEWLAHLIGAPASSLRVTYMWRADITILVAGLAFFLMANLFRSRKGRAMRLMRENDVAAELVGVSLPAARVTAFVVAAACAGLGGGLTTMIETTVYGSTFTLALSIQILTLLVIGGIGTLSGSLIGGMFYAYSITWIASLVSGIGLNSSSNLGSEMNNIIFGALLIICVLVAPLGIAGTIQFVISRRWARRRTEIRNPMG
jgi:branched-chain amino acid transport system permease protein